jgi:hypothetical protein
MDFSRVLSFALGIREMSIPKPEVPSLEDLSPIEEFFDCCLGKRESWFREWSAGPPASLKALLWKFSKSKDFCGACLGIIGGFI